MTKNEMKTMTKQWLLFKGFGKCKIKALGESCYFYPMKDFDILVSFNKDRFDECYGIAIGFQFKDEPNGWGHIDIQIPNEKYWQNIKMADGSTVVVKDSFYYDDWNEEDYLECLEKIYELHIKPYLDLGVGMLKILAKERPNALHPHAKERILKM